MKAAHVSIVLCTIRLESRSQQGDCDDALPPTLAFDSFVFATTEPLSKRQACGKSMIFM